MFDRDFGAVLPIHQLSGCSSLLPTLRVNFSGQVASVQLRRQQDIVEIEDQLSPVLSPLIYSIIDVCVVAERYAI